VIYEKLGTKGLVLSRGEVLREINRSFYHADRYEYPIAIFQTRSGRVLMAHCPEEYCRLELEDIRTGERLTVSRNRKPDDFFHSRLRVSADGRWLLSAGWVWHPWSAVTVFDLEAALQEPAMLDRSAQTPNIEGEVAAAEFLPDNRILVATSDEETLSGEDTEEGAIGPNSLAVFNPATREVTSCAHTDEPVGTLMPVDEASAMGFYGHPKLFSLKTGNVLKRWDGINSGNQTSSIIWSGISVPPIACDIANKRFAVADEAFVSVVHISA
jgi:hypothetical protein